MLRRIQLAVLARIIARRGAFDGLPRSCSSWSTWASSSSAAAYVVTRFGLADLEAGYVLDRLHAQAGDVLRASYTVRNSSRLPKLWLEVHNPSTLPVDLPGHAVTLGPRAEKSWSVRVPLTRRGHFRVEPLALRTGDPLGLFESHASVGSASNVIVYPRVESLPGWRLPPAFIEGSHAHPVRTPHTTPHATSIRPYAPGDSYNRIHWRSTARQGELQVKEFDLEQTADVWIFLDLQRSAHTGRRRRIDARIRRAPGGIDRRPGAAREPQRGHVRVGGAHRSAARPTAGRASTRRSCRSSRRSWPTAMRPWPTSLSMASAACGAA